MLWVVIFQLPFQQAPYLTWSIFYETFESKYNRSSLMYDDIIFEITGCTMLTPRRLFYGKVLAYYVSQFNYNFDIPYKECVYFLSMKK